MAAVIGCSTSSDLAAGRAQRLQPGDVVEVEVDRLGVLRTVIVGPQERKAGS
ncbi:fumarylacetoacetate hydrolase family protein [Nakamurella multipartita]|jgi:2-keto-4-pentenoate hydratase/2-oxohepta-3-ene-1,7-dioic acid hydratase in catechol pathway|uniref:fumarylacetoacetate hydrolase family protein n=1 Tax=Nakamurella multipartita TaxID=53461 RepID=UPI00019E8D02|nr:fumarylacetoacetate hydrolase family protein [Nakamurella multipartita]